MTFKLSPKKEAKELYNKFYNIGTHYIIEVRKDGAKQSALLAVDEILKVAFYATDEIYEHYLQVKTEIEKL
jgi:hypothetical protein